MKGAEWGGLRPLSSISSCPELPPDPVPSEQENTGCQDRGQDSPLTLLTLEGTMEGSVSGEQTTAWSTPRSPETLSVCQLRGRHEGQGVPFLLSGEQLGAQKALAYLC